MKYFRRFDPRLLADLKRQRKPILLGLACVIVTSLLTTSTIWMIERAVRAISDATPQGGRAGSSALNPLDPSGSDERRLAEELGVPVDTVRKIEAAAEAAVGRQRREALVQAAIEEGVAPEKAEQTFGLAQETAQSSESRRSRALQTLALVSLAIFGVYIVKYFFTRGQSYFLSLANAKLAADLRARLFDKLQRLPITYFNKQRSGEIQSVLTNDVNVYLASVNIVRDSIDGPVKAVSALLTIFIIQWKLALLAILAFPIMWWFIQRNGMRMRVAQRKVQDDLGILNAVTQEALQGTRVTKAFNAEVRMREVYGNVIERTLRSQLAAARRVAALRPMVELIGAGAMAVVLYACGLLAYQGQLAISQIAALIFAFDVINQGFRAIGYVNNIYNQVQAASNRIYDLVLDVDEEHADRSGSLTLPDPKGHLTFEHVSFVYPDGTQALQDVSFEIPPGASLAIVGPSGAGKSTIADLVLRFYDPTSGRILFDGVDIRELDVHWLRSQMAVVPQQNFLFAGTLEDNLRLGAPLAGEAELVEATRIAHADVFIDKLPEGLATEVGERGTGLSGGETQRIAIARALVRQPKLLLLDEATSALDAHSEKAVQEALDEVMQSRTTLFIAHRLSTAARAQRILVLRRGEVIEQGSHRDLMEANGAYASMYRAFSSGVLGDAVVE